MNERQKRFAREYVIDLNATRAAVAAGYSPKTANEQGSQVLANLSVRRYVDKLLSERATRLEVKADRVVEEMARLAFSNMQDYIAVAPDGTYKGIDFSKLSRDQASAIQEIREDTTGGSGDGERKLILRTTLKLADKSRNLELLARHLGIFQDKLHVTGLEGLADRLAEARKNKANASR